jgi:branched-chain amino acid transport system substrate-binding protein
MAREFGDAVRKAGGDSQRQLLEHGGLPGREGADRGAAQGTGQATRDSLVAGLESIDRQQFGGFEVSFSAKNHVGSKFVELSMLTGDGRVRT